MDRRKFLIGAGSAAVGSSAFIGSGAFTSVQAERDLTLNVADDSNALLAISATDDSPNADDYVDVDGGVIGIDVPGDADGDGVNREATTIIRSLFDITNQGTQGVLVFIQGGPDGVGFFADNFDHPDNRPDVGLGVADNPADAGQPDNAPEGESKSERRFLKPGESLTDVGLFVTDADALESDDTDSITIVAATPDEIYFSNLGGYDDVEDYDNADDDPNFDPADLEDRSDWS